MKISGVSRLGRTSLLASAIVCGSAAYMVVSASPLPGLDSANVPERFTVYVDGKPSFDCRLIDITDHKCEGEPDIFIERQPGDKTRVRITFMGSNKHDIVTWAELATEGVVLGPRLGRRAHPAFRVTATPLSR